MRSKWRRSAQLLAEHLPRRQLHPAVMQWAEAHAGETWGVAFSGGGDSLALLLLIWAHWPEQRRRLLGLHFNHRLRGAAAAADETFCRTVCAGLGVKLRCGAWREAHDDASEAEARAARQAFFAAELKKAGARALWLGHQQDDVAETLLMRLARGSGLSGLAAPRPLQTLAGGRIHLRPLLTLKRSEIEAALRATEAGWRTDATNAGNDFLRNRIRNRVLPAWQEATGERDMLAGAALARELIEEDDAAMEAWVREVDALDKTGALRLRRVAGKPRGLVRRVLQQWLAQHGKAGVLSRQAFSALLDDVMRGRMTRHSVGAGVFARIGRTNLTLCSSAGKTRRNSMVPPIDL